MQIEILSVKVLEKYTLSRLGFRKGTTFFLLCNHNLEAEWSRDRSRRRRFLSSVFEPAEVRGQV